MAVELARPTDGVRTGLPKSVVLNLVDVREVDPPAGESVHWRLLTALPVADAAEAFAVADLYRRRWAIEQLFRTLKTKGFDIEAVRIGEDGPRSKLAMAALVAAVTIQQLVHARDGGARQSRLRPVTDAFGADDLPLIEALCKASKARPNDNATPTPGLARLCGMGLRPPRRMDRLLRQARPHRHAPGLARVPSRQARRRPHGPSTQCVNLLARRERSSNAP